MNIITKPEAIVLFSGGLDSLLSARILQEQGVKVRGVCLVSNFFQAEEAKQSAQEINLPLDVIDISRELLEIVKDPPTGYGKNLNPCIDCRALMLETVYNRYIKSKRKKFLASGEVLGQRPLSQTKTGLNKVKKRIDIEVLRPLSAQLLPETKAERKNWVDRDKLYSFQGRDRTQQLNLAQYYHISQVPSVAGGCLLTEASFVSKLQKLLQHNPQVSPEEVEIMKYGRNFWFTDTQGNKVLTVIARDKFEVNKLMELHRQQDTLLTLTNVLGPVAVIMNRDKPQSLNSEFKIDTPESLENIDIRSSKSINDIIYTSSKLLAYYKPKLRGTQVLITIN